MEPPAPARLLGPAVPRHPVILSVPHAGRVWTDAMRARAAYSPDALRPLEDRHADALVATAVEAGFTALVAQTPRAWVDLNRAPDDLDWPRLAGEPARTVSARAAAGIGIVPDRMARLGSIWCERLSRVDVTERVRAVHAPFHDRLAALMDEAARRFGHVLLLDVHSMPQQAGRRIDIALGTRRGRSVAGEWAARARGLLAAGGRRVAIDTPYAGAHIAERHGDPRRGRHVLQFEICRSLYLDGREDGTGPGLERAQADVLALANGLSVAMTAPLAAE